MRPDHHKKKKNAIYKKAHGLVTDKGQNDEENTTKDKNAKENTTKNNTTKNTKLQKSPNTKRQTIKPTQQKTNKNNKEQLLKGTNGTLAAESPQQEKETDSDREQKEIEAYFSKRKIENNWEKYEKDPNEKKEEEEKEEEEEDEIIVQTSYKISLEPHWSDVGHIIHIDQPLMQDEEKKKEEQEEIRDEDGDKSDINNWENKTEINNVSSIEITEEITEISTNKNAEESKLLIELEALTNDFKPAINLKETHKIKCIDELEDELDDLLNL